MVRLHTIVAFLGLTAIALCAGCTNTASTSTTSSSSDTASSVSTPTAADSSGTARQAPAAVQSVSSQSLSFDGRVLGAGSPIAKSTVTAWWATSGDPKQLGEVQSDDQGRFSLNVQTPGGPAGSFYVTALGGEPAAHGGAGNNAAIGLIAVLGNTAPAHITINEFTTLASVWTNAQFFDGKSLRGPGLSLTIAAGNVPNLADLQSGGWGEAIQDGLNSIRTPTMANFATLASIMAGCVTRVTSDACDKFFSASIGPGGGTPTDTLQAAASIARNQAYQPQRVFALLNTFYPVPQGKNLRPTPFQPYLSFAPSAWTFPLKFTGGGIVGSARVVFDSHGDAWVGSNFIVGSQGTDALWDGNIFKIAPNGKPLSPVTSGFSGGGLQGPGYGTAVDANDRVWVDSTNGRTISLFANDGRPLSPPEGYNFGGKLGFMQGIMVAPNSDVWAVDFGKDDVIYMPKGDPSKSKFYCDAPAGTPNKDSVCKLHSPFYLLIDQQNRIWIDSAFGDTVTRFPASDPSKAEVFKTGGASGKGMAVDSKGNVWIANTAGSGLSLETKLHLLDLKATHGSTNALHQVVLDDLLSHRDLGNVSELRPDGKPAPGSPFNPGSIWGAWAVAVDGDDHVWISNFAPNGGITELCGARTETCPPGMKTGDPISPKGGFMGGGMEMLVDVNIDPAGNVWVSNNWDEPKACYGQASEELSTRCGGQGVTIFYGLAKPIRSPLIGAPQQL